MLMIAPLITVDGIDSMRTVFTETGDNSQIQRQLITPGTAQPREPSLALRRKSDPALVESMAATIVLRRHGVPRQWFICS